MQEWEAALGDRLSFPQPHRRKSQLRDSTGRQSDEWNVAALWTPFSLNYRKQRTNSFLSQYHVTQTVCALELPPLEQTKVLEENDPVLTALANSPADGLR